MTNSNTEFRAAIQERLRKDGVLDEITASIRSRIMKTLLHDGTFTSTSSRAPPQLHGLQRQSISLLWLLYHFLEQQGFTHTLSVFAAESRLEHSTPSSITDAIRDIGLLEIWDEVRENHRIQPGDFISSLQAVVLWANSLREKYAALQIQLAKNRNYVYVSTSVQTDDGTTLPTCHNDDEQTEINRAICNEFTIIEIERECQRRMRQEMNEKLRLSAKKQAIQATRRLEHKHKEVLQALNHQIEAERTHAKRRESELTKELTQQQTLAHQEREHSELRIQTMTLEMQSQQREMDLLNERVKVMQKQRFHEWTDEHELFQKKTRASLNELHDDKRKLHRQMHEVSLQKDDMISKELQFASLAREKSTLLEEIQDLQHRQTAVLALQQSFFDRRQAEIKAQLDALQEKYISAKGDLELSRNEVVGLQTLLKQSQAAIESVSFRDNGPTSAISPPAMLSRRSMTPSTQLVHGAQPNFGTNFLSTIHPSSSATYKTDSISIMHESNGKHHAPHPAKEEITMQYTIPDCLPPTENDHAGKIHNSNPLTVENTSHRTHPSGKNRNQIMDPPCIASKDPPAINLPQHYEERWGQDNDMEMSKTYEADDVNCNCHGGSLVGNEIVLNISSITDDFPRQVGSAARSLPSLVQVAMSAETSIPAVMPSIGIESEQGEAEGSIDADEAYTFDQPAVDGGLLIESSAPIETSEEFQSEIESEHKLDESEEFKWRPEPHQHSCSIDGSTHPSPVSNNHQWSSPSIAVSEPCSEQFYTGHTETMPPSTMDNRRDNVDVCCHENESEQHDSPHVPNQPTFEYDGAHAIVTTSAVSPQRSMTSSDDSAPQSEQSQVEEEIKITANRDVEVGGDRHPLGLIQSIDDLDESHATECANNAQRSSTSIADSEQYSDHFYSLDEGKYHQSEPDSSHAAQVEPHVTVTARASTTLNDLQRSTQSDSDSDSHSEQSWEEEHGAAHATATANNHQRSASSVADSDQYSEHFDTIDEGNYYLTEPVAASPRSRSISSENYSDEFSSISERQ